MSPRGETRRITSIISTLNFSGFVPEKTEYPTPFIPGLIESIGKIKGRARIKLQPKKMNRV
jgi:hypothetical protein